MSSRSNLTRTAATFASKVLWKALDRSGRGIATGRPGGARRPRSQRPTSHPASDYPGDYAGAPTLTYAPKPDGKPDPGEIVWGWVPYEEDYSQGKDRPVLLVGRDDGWLLGLMLTSKDHDRDAEQERRAGRLWCDIGSGDWDPRHRNSEVRVNRVIRLSESSIRREGSVLPREEFELVAGAVRAAYK